MIEKKILLIEDELDVHKLVRVILRSREGYTLYTAKNAHEGLEKFHRIIPDLVLLDIMLKDTMTGWDLCKHARGASNIPIIMVTAIPRTEGDTDNVVKGLQMGANDFVPKPFAPLELRARVDVLLRQDIPLQFVGENMPGYSDETLIINLEERQVICEGVMKENLTKKEYEILRIILDASPKAASYKTIRREVGWPASGDNYVRQYIGLLREKIEPNPKKPIYIVTKRGEGYAFNGKGRLLLNAKKNLQLAARGSSTFG